MAAAEQEAPITSAGTTTTTKESRKTLYVILASVDGGTTWVRQGEQEATTKATALSHFYEARDLPEAEDTIVHPSEYVLFQAVPKSSWKALKPAPPRPRVPFSEVD